MIRKAEKKDAKQLADIAYIVLAELYEPIANNAEIEKLQKQDLISLIQRNDVPMSYQNVTVFEEEGALLGAIWSYDYSNFTKMLETLYRIGEQENIKVPHLIEEAKTGDYYIDTIAVLPQARGKSVAKKLLKYIISQNKEKPITLIVDKEKAIPLHIYQKLGFETVEKNEMYGSIYYYMKYNGAEIKRGIEESI